MNLHLVFFARALGAACLIAVVYAVVTVLMVVIDQRREQRALENHRERDYWRTATADPRRSARRQPRNAA